MLFCVTLYAGMNDDIYTMLFEKYGESSKITHVNIKVDPGLKSIIEMKTGQKFFRDNLHCYKILDANGNTYTGLLDNVYGKTLPITFLVVYDETGKINDCFIVKYREPRGYGVKQQSWLNQFVGKDANSEFKVGSEIHGITGSTISVNSVARGIRKLSILYEKLKSEL